MTFWRAYAVYLVVYSATLWLFGWQAALAVFAGYAGFMLGRNQGYGRGLRHGGAIWHYTHLKGVEAVMVEEYAPGHPARAWVAEQLADTARRLPKRTVIEMQKAAHGGRPKGE